MKQKLIYLLIIPLFAFSIHKFYLSLTKIDFNKEKQVVQITMRCFIDDIENAINQKNNTTLELATDLEPKKADSLLQIYLLENFKISINKEKKILSYLGKEYKKDIVCFYLEIDSIPFITNIKVTDKILMANFEDQQNIIKLHINDKKKAFVLKNDDYSFLYSY